MSGKNWLWAVAGAMILLVCLDCRSQTAGKAGETEYVQQAQTFPIPLTATARQTATPVRDLTESDFALEIDGKPRGFQLVRPWARLIDPKTGQPQDRPNLLIVVPLANPLDREQAIDDAIAYLSGLPELGWNISILDDGGTQTPYTRSLKTAIAELRIVKGENPADVDLKEWRATAALAIAGMRDLPGRRVVMALGDIFHEVIVDQGELVYDAYQIDDLATAARNSGVVIYVADGASEVEGLRGLTPHATVLGPEKGPGPWLLLTQRGQVAGWIAGSVADAVAAIRRNGMGAYRAELHLDLQQMDGQAHRVLIVPHRAGVLFNAPGYFVAPDLARLRQLSGVSSALRRALRTPPTPGSSPLELTSQLAYFPHRDGKTGTQMVTTGFFWNASTPPPTAVETALELSYPTSGYVLNTTVEPLDWNTELPVWNAALDVGPGMYRVRVAAADANGNNAAVDMPFTIDPSSGESVLISSLVLGKSCLFDPVPIGQGATDYLRAGNCELHPDPTRIFSRRDVVWTLVRITPIGKLAGRPAKDWKASFKLIDAQGFRRAEQRVHWLPTDDGSFVASAAFPLDNPKIKNGEYDVVFRLKGPGIQRDYGEDAMFQIHDAMEASSKN